MLATKKEWAVNPPVDQFSRTMEVVARFLTMFITVSLLDPE